MFAFINMLKNFENRISQTEMVETQYTSREYYQNENFNLNSFTRVIIDKIKDSSNLINILDSSLNEIKDEILNQINSNFSNHLILISKIQTVDFLIENIEKPLDLIRNKIQNKLNLLIKNENELKSTIENLNKNERTLRQSKIYFSYFKFFSQAKILEKTILLMKESSIYKGFVENTETVSLLMGYDFFKTLLIHSYRYLSINEKKEKMIKDLTEGSTNKEIKNKEFSFGDFIEHSNNQKKFEDYVYTFLETILERCLKDTITNTKAKEEIYCCKTFLRLIHDCYRIKFKLNIFYEKIKNSLFENHITDILRKTELNLEHIDKITNFAKNELFRQLEDFLEEKYNLLYDVVKKNKYQFNLICIWNPIVENLNTNKNLFLCIDPEIFSKILNSFLNLMEKYPVACFEELTSKFNCSKNNKEDTLPNSKFSKKNGINITNKINNRVHDVKKVECANFCSKDLIRSFFQNFSYFTYFQFIQNDLTKIIINSSILRIENDINHLDFNKNQTDFESSKKYDQFNKELFDFSNLLFNFNNYNKNLFVEKKVFLKNVPNYLNFIYGNFLLISKKILDYFANDKNKFCSKMKEELKLNLLEVDNNIHDLSNYCLKIKENIKEFLKNIYNYFGLINEIDLNLADIFHREIFIFQSLEDFKRLEICFNKLKQTTNLKNINQLIIDSKYFEYLLEFHHDLDRQAFNYLINK